MHRPISITLRPDFCGPEASAAWDISVRKELTIHAAQDAKTGKIVIRLHWNDGIEHMSATSVNTYDEMVAFASRLRTNRRRFKRNMRRWNGQQRSASWAPRR